MYKLQPTYDILKEAFVEPRSVIRLSDGAIIPFAPDNTDYQTFKAQINADEAQLEDATGVVMSPDEAKAFVATLPQ